MILSSWIEKITIGFLAIIGLLDVLDRYGVNVPWFSKNKFRDVKRVAEHTISRVYEKDYQFLLDNEEQRINSFLVQLGINTDQFLEVKSEIFRLRRMQMKSREAMEQKLLEISTGRLALVDQRNASERLYNKVITPQKLAGSSKKAVYAAVIFEGCL